MSSRDAGIPRSGVRATISNKLNKATAAAGKGMTAVGRAGRQLGSSCSDLDDGTASQPRVSAYAGMGPTGTAQDVSTSILVQGSGFRSLCSLPLFPTRIFLPGFPSRVGALRLSGISCVLFLLWWYLPKKFGYPPRKLWWLPSACKS